MWSISSFLLDGAYIIWDLCKKNVHFDNEDEYYKKEFNEFMDFVGILH